MNYILNIFILLKFPLIHWSLARLIYSNFLDAFQITQRVMNESICFSEANVNPSNYNGTH